MSPVRIRTVALAGGLTAVLSASVALAATTQTYSQKFTTKHPGQSTGLTFAASSTGTGGAAPVQAKTVTLTFPAGTKIDTGAVKSGAEVGSGKATVLVGGVTAMSLDVTASNRKGGMTLSVVNPLGHPIVLKPGLSGGKLTLLIPKFNVAGQTIILSKLSLSISKAGSAKRPYARTPKKCPAGGWKFTGSFVYVDGTKQTLTSKSACVKH